MSEPKDKIVSYEDGKVKVKFEKTLDPNGDGEPLGSISLNVELNIGEIPDEAYDAYKAMKIKK